MLLNLPIILFECAFRLTNFALDPGSEVYGVNEGFLVIVVLLEGCDKAYYVDFCFKLILIEPGDL